MLFVVVDRLVGIAARALRQFPEHRVVNNVETDQVSAARLAHVQRVDVLRRGSAIRAGTVVVLGGEGVGGGDNDGAGVVNQRYKWALLPMLLTFQVVKCEILCSSSEKVFYTMMNIVASSRNLRPNGLKTGRVPQFLVGLVVCIWLVYQITQPQHGSVRTKISVDEGVHSLGRKQTAGQLNVGGENLDMSNGKGEMVEGESSSSTEGEGENIQVDLQGGGKRGKIAYSDETNKNDEDGKRVEIAYSDETNKTNQGSSSNKGNLQSAKRGEIAYSDETNKKDEDGKRVEIAYSDETNKNDQGSSTSKVSENLLETVTSYRGSDGKDVSQDKDEPAIDQEGEENSAATQNITIRSQYDVFSDENGIPKEMRDGSSLNDQSESS
nr:uncharacterized protein LOC109162619 isoform X2 [Ipomoea batatas]